MRLISVEELKIFLEKTDNNQDELLEQIITSVSSRIQTYLNRTLEKGAKIEYFNGGRRKYYISAPPIDTTVTVSAYSDDALETEGTDYFVWENDGLLEFYYEIPATEPKNVEIRYTGGYTSTNGIVNVPEDLKYACRLQSAFEYRTRNSIGMNSISMPDGSVQYLKPNELLPEVKTLIRIYRRTPGER